MKPNYLRWAGLTTILAAALLYLFTLDTGLRPDELTGGDLITHQYAQVEARPSNAPGYPLYTMGGWLWFHTAKTPLAWLLNPTQVLSAYSMLWGLASLAVLYLILLNLTRRRWAIAALLTAFHATTFFFWYYSVTTEQYTSAVFQTLLLIWLALRWDNAPSDALLLAMAFVSGTMLANMVTTLFILPPLLGFIFLKTNPTGWRGWHYLKRPKLILQAVGVALLPLVSYAYIYIRGAQHPEWRGSGQWASAWEWFVAFITIQQGRDELAPGLGLQTFFTAEFPSLMWRELTWLVFVGGLIGLALLGRRRAIFFYSTLVIYFIFCWGYRFGNWFQVIIPAYPIFIIGFAALLAHGLAWAGRFSRRRWASGLTVLFLMGLLLFNLSRNYASANQRYQPDDTGLAPGWAILADKPTPPALIGADFEEWVALQYLAQVWGAAPGITVTSDAAALLNSTPPGNRYASRRAWAATEPHRRGQLQAAGAQLIQLAEGPITTLNAAATPVELNFGGKLSVRGWEVIPTDNTAAATLWQLALYWQAAAPLEADYTISVRPLVGGQLIMNGAEPIIQDHQPVWGAYPTSRWLPGELVRDVYALPLPRGVQPDAAQIVVYQTTAAGFENLGEAVLPLR